MAEITVINMRTDRRPCVVIDRSGPLGNAYTHMAGGAHRAMYKVKTREEAIRCGTEALYDALMAGDPDKVSAVAELIVMHMRGEDILLGCWCKPRPCHGDEIRNGILDDTFIMIPHVRELVDRILLYYPIEDAQL